MLPNVFTRKVAQKYVAVNQSIVLNIGNVTDMIINKKHREIYNTKLSFYERIVEMNISMYCIMYFDEIMKKLSCYYFTLFSTL